MTHDVSDDYTTVSSICHLLFSSERKRGLIKNKASPYNENDTKLKVAVEKAKSGLVFTCDHIQAFRL